ncbi:AMP-binding protein [Streptomyces sparsogenes]|uniref:AMP-binding domain protein n=1 Tax=Streptomyces sparsogenes DSM 40356 TaxID=1331668 RepID=A0A1R1SRY8_9ACTN|nr:AMP-binding protein [Streptomyces sparsogenes]OMI41035.1 AMP-binding domain protein [Streptomyces sparsogenes DSM 40356]
MTDRPADPSGPSGSSGPQDPADTAAPTDPSASTRTTGSTGTAASAGTAATAGAAAPAPALAYASGAGEVPLLGDTIGANLARAIERFGEREALVDLPSGRRWTYTEFGRAVEEVALGLMAKGVGKGDRVGIWAVNCAEWVLVQYATARIGAIMVNINPAYRVHELKLRLRRAGISVLISSTEHRTSDYRRMVEQVRSECPALRDVIYIGDRTWDGLIRAGADVSRERLLEREARLSCDDPVNIQYTSGTTGLPKGATLSHHNILNNGYSVGETLGYTPQDRVCLPVPFSHCFGMVTGNLGATSHGACIVIPAPTFDPAATLRAVEQERCTSLYGVPTMFIAELGLPDFDAYDLSSLRTGIIAGATCPPEVMRRVVEEMHMAEVSAFYGMTELSPVSIQTRRDDDLRHRTGTVGRVLPHIEIKVVDPVTGVTVPRGTRGELCTRGYSVMLGYWEEPERTAEVIDAGRWMHTGDLAVMDEDGYVRIVGRMKDMIVRGGENVYPREIEEFLYTHPKIADVQVVGVPDEKYGEEILACVILREGARSLSRDELARFCRGRLAHYKVPRYLRIMEAFPRTVSGKVRKVELREAGIGDAVRLRDARTDAADTQAVPLR